MKDLEIVKQKYKLSNKEHEEIGNQINQIMLFNKYPVEKPKAIINIAPPASGKTGLNSYGNEQFLDNNVVIINSDELKPFHPKINEIAKLYPEFYTKVTDQESNTWTSDLFDTVLKEGYNVIFEGTGKNARILDTIKTKMKNYEVIVRGMAVNELNCLISILDRYESQLETRGWGRLVILEHFYETYNEMPNTIDAIEKSGIVDNVQVFKRGNKPSEPIKIYDSKDIEMGRFPNAKYAILGGRNEDKSKANQYLEVQKDEIIRLLSGKKITEEENEIFMKILELNENTKKKENNKKNIEI